MKRDLEASNGVHTDAQTATRAAEARAAAAIKRAAAAETAAEAAQRECASHADAEAAARKETRVVLGRMEAASCAALRDAEVAASERLHELTARLAVLDAENRGLQGRLADARERSPSPARLQQQQQPPRSGVREAIPQMTVVPAQPAAALVELQRRNMELQRALVRKHVAEVRHPLCHRDVLHAARMCNFHPPACV